MRKLKPCYERQNLIHKILMSQCLLPNSNDNSWTDLYEILCAYLSRSENRLTYIRHIPK